MSMPIGPIWSVLHLAIKFPAATVIVAVGAVYLSSDVTETPPNTFAIPEIIAPDSGPMIALTFDDGWRSVYDVALPEMHRRGLVGTNYITTNFVDGWEGYISSSHLPEFVTAGWEIGAHSLDHDDLTTLPHDEMISNLLLPQMQLSNWIGQPITAFSTPYGNYNDAIIEQAQASYNTHVNAWGPYNGMNTVETFDPYNINRLDTARITIDGVCQTLTELGEDDFYAIIFHRIIEEEGEYNISPDDFSAILDCVEDSGVHVVTVSQGAQRMLERAQ
jgi:peptidoglycan/xylan/chitin deacetylase (PgdA/CDA1 family)